VVGYFGRMSEGKGIFTLLEAANAAMLIEPKLHCLWVGDGPDAALLRERIAAQLQTAHRHHFTGWVHDVHPYYKAISVLAFPSKLPETFGRVAVEAQACEVPVLGSDIGGVPETLQAGVTGFLLPPIDVDAWREAILAMTDNDRRQTMGAAAREFVAQHFSTTVIAEEFANNLTGNPPAVGASRASSGMHLG
jgi:glycosyltransferase involved in cell wall biosynthesis